MAKLGNERHEKFAQNLAKGMGQAAAYEAAGFKSNAGGASRLARSRPVVERVAELRKASLPALKAPVATTDTPVTLDEMGFTRQWIAQQYYSIYSQSREIGSLNDANKALASLERMRSAEEGEVGVDAAKVHPDSRIDINALGAVMDKFANVLAIAKQEPGQPPMKDVTPPANAVPSTAQIRAHRASENEN
jgi:hypothetical protein